MILLKQGVDRDKSDKCGNTDMTFKSSEFTAYALTWQHNISRNHKAINCPMQTESTKQSVL